VTWEVEITDEFKGWFEALTSEEQISIDAHVQMLIEYGPQLPTLTVRKSRVRKLRTCESCEFSTPASRTEFCTRSTRDELRCC